jgi:tetratricopeptide (TPR) repeat protein
MKFCNQKNNSFIFIAIICFLVIVVFSFSINFPILNSWDDQYYIIRNKHLALNFQNIFFWITTPYFHMYIPLTMFTYMFDFYIWGYNSFGYHLQNIIWHVIACVFIYKCFSFFKINQVIIFCIVLIYSIHPQRVESVVWISERKDVMCCAFYFASIYFYLKDSRRDKRFSICAFLLYLCAFFSKPMAMSLPFILLFYNIYKYKSFNIKYYFNKLWMYFLVLFVFVLIAFKYQATADCKFILSKQIYVVFYNIVWYISKTIFPTGLNPIYARTDINNSFLYLLCMYILLLSLLVILLVRSRKVYIYIPIILCYLISLAPVSGFVSWGVSDKADRWSYIPSVFIWFFLAVLLSNWIYKVKSDELKSIINSKILIMIITLYIILLMILNVIYQQNWQNTYSIYYRTSVFTPANKYALWILSKYEMKDKNFLNASVLAERMRKSDNFVDRCRADYIIANCYFENKKYKKTVNVLKTFTSINHEFALKILENSKEMYSRMLSMIAFSYMNMKQKQKAVEYFNKIILLNSDMPSVRFYYLGMKYLLLKNYDKALFYFRKAKLLDSNNEIISKRILQIEYGKM